MIDKFAIPSPAVTIDLDIAQKNIFQLIERAKKANIKVRPHMKVHKSAYFAKKQIEAGACGVTTAKLSEAEVMVANGIDNILIAYPVFGKEKWERFGSLNRKANLVVTVDSLEIANGLNEIGDQDHPVHVLIEVDFGIHRCGVQPGEEFIKFASKIKEMKGLRIDGVFTYNGLIYASKSIDEIRQSAESEAKLLLDCQRRLQELGIATLTLSGGNTPDILALDKMKGITEIRPGNFLYNDVSGMDLGVAAEQDCALRILATVVSVPCAGHATIDAGSKTLTSDGAAKSSGYGYIVGMPDVKLVKLNEEHGYLSYAPCIRSFKVGERIEIIPNHACVISNLCDMVFGIRAEKIVAEIPIEARGKNY
jgi:D-serine deaminase-like pyridoxal phosphate-dependent protein